MQFWQKIILSLCVKRYKKPENCNLFERFCNTNRMIQGLVIKVCTLTSFTHDILDLCLSLSLDWWKQKLFLLILIHPVCKKGEYFSWDLWKKNDNISKLLTYFHLGLRGMQLVLQNAESFYGTLLALISKYYHWKSHVFIDSTKNVTFRMIDLPF